MMPFSTSTGLTLMPIELRQRLRHRIGMPGGIGRAVDRVADLRPVPRSRRPERRWCPRLPCPVGHARKLVASIHRQVVGDVLARERLPVEHELEGHLTAAHRTAAAPGSAARSIPAKCRRYRHPVSSGARRGRPAGRARPSTACATCAACRAKCSPCSSSRSARPLARLTSFLVVVAPVIEHVGQRVDREGNRRIL